MFCYQDYCTPTKTRHKDLNIVQVKDFGKLKVPKFVYKTNEMTKHQISLKITLSRTEMYIFTQRTPIKQLISHQTH